MGELPGGKCVCRETLVHQAERAHELGIVQFRIETRNLRGEQQSLVDDGPGGQRRDIEFPAARKIRILDLDLDALADDVELALEIVFGVDGRTPTEEYLLNVRLGVARETPDGVSVGRRVAPAKDFQAFLAGNALKDAFARETLLALDGQEDHPHTVVPRRREMESELDTLARKKRVRNLNQQPSAISRFGVAAAGAAMGEIDEDLNTAGNDVVRSIAFDVGDEADAARVAFVAGVVKALRFRQAMTGRRRSCPTAYRG